MYKIASLIVGSFVIPVLTAAQVNNEADQNSQQSESISPRTYVQTQQPEMCLITPFSTPSEAKTAHYEIMNLAGGYSELIDQSRLADVVEQSVFIESIRHELAPKKSEKRPSPLASKIPESEKVFGNSHTEAALSIVRVHSKHTPTLLPDVKFVGWGGRFMDKIHRFEMLYSVDELPITSEQYAMLLFSYIEDINLHEERFAPYLATFPFSPEEYELRFMLPGYRISSTKENPQPVFIFNVGETVCTCHREKESGRLKIFKKELFNDIIKRVNEMIAQEKEKEKSTEALAE